MAQESWQFGPANGTLTLHTGVTGPASRTGHRLTIEMQQWSATVTLSDGVPSDVSASIDVDSLTVVSGEGLSLIHI